MAWIGLLFFILLDILQPRCLSHAKRDTLKQGEQLLDSDRLISANGVYSVQFFSLDLIKKISPSPRYVGICFSETISSDSASVVWVANIYNPSPDTSGVLSIDTDGILKITYSGGQPIVVSSNQGTKSSKSNITATILDSGNLVLREAGYNGMVGPVLWQSFDYPTEVLLPEMKLGFNLKTGHEWYLSSWLSPQLPCPGAFRLGLDPNGSSQLIVWRRGEVYWKSGLWKSGSFSQAPELTKLVGQYEFKFVKNENESYFHFTARNRSTLLIWQLSYWGSIFLKILDLDGSTIYKLESIKPCNRSTNNRTAVCLNEKPSKCRAASEFFDTIKGYMDQNDWGYNDYNSSLARPDCHTKCWKNCSCIAYKSAFSNGSGCTFWARGSNFFPNNESLEEFYLLHSEFNRDSSSGGKTKNERSRSIKRWWLIWTILAVVLAIALLASAILCHLRRSQGKLKIIHKESLVSFTSAVTTANNPFDGSQLKKGKRKEEFQMFSFLQITAATNNFSSSCKLGEGGFGPVYKGILPNGLQFAVKRLSRTSGQGLVEFENEITLIAELQHMNLVTLLGYCIEGDEKMLIYEYMPNKSLDSFLFDPIKRRRLEWKTRFNIIEGIAQGLLYLHKYSRLRIIHRDLKASNILLDDQMNPKISDFGLARIFGHTDYEANTKRVVGTYGYMSPEYAMNGIFSAKSDVYSFGVLLLEIISGLRNTAFSLTSGPLTLIEHAWNLWSTDACLDLVDKSLGSSCPENEILRCVHVSLLCVQECAMDRPTMSEVAIMLTNESMSLPYPNQPPSYVTRSGNGTPLPDRKSDPCSVYSVSVTEMEGR